ncbi:uncharacterized protein ACLA_024140 [Aspergillus clavatus NRRL 1]|uniref:GPI anchored protein n=1 Tax=Aspergillus clavatus (strain ATCC 1007 / CBS 513.65 / DSM 816 / NCTC 3887 / NRRL 1 / QM 1276 / 107) TaxID=344612 RepID=A1CPX8_ASPCL|nr:uncharacterized protein ACLA_024140 [Aspergillus clavatus NRRL 1]EAW07699.1 conserved hypothetical protein [Aspergillus clavatus NRRL 1]
MRSGLRKPGAIPFIALILFSILSLVPSLAKEWDFYNLQIGYRGLSRNEVRHLSPMKDGSIDVRPRTRSTGPQCKSWPDCKMRPRRASSVASPVSAVERVTIIDSDPIPLAVTKPSSLARGVRAFKTFLIKNWDEYQIPQPVSTKSAPTEASRSLPPLANSSLIPGTHASEEQSPITNQSTPAPNRLLDQYRIRFASGYHDAWQQACRVTAGFLENLLASTGAISSHSNISIPVSQSRATPPLFMELEDGVRPLMGAILQITSADVPSESTNLLNETTAAGQPDVARVDPEPKKMRGSCMAIVIGLVAGVMWF